MRFEDVLPELRKGSKVRRGAWAEGIDMQQYWSDRGVVLYYTGAQSFLQLSAEDINAADWDLVTDGAKLRAEILQLRTELEALRRRNVVCRHDEPHIFCIASGGVDRWCRTCGALRLESTDGWLLPEVRR